MLKHSQWGDLLSNCRFLGFLFVFVEPTTSRWRYVSDIYYCPENTPNANQAVNNETCKNYYKTQLDSQADVVLKGNAKTQCDFYQNAIPEPFKTNRINALEETVQTDLTLITTEPSTRCQSGYAVSINLLKVVYHRCWRYFFKSRFSTLN